MSNTTYCPVSRTLGRRPEQLLPAIPYLLGYHPTDSLVCLFFDSASGMRLSSRVDWDTTRLAVDDVADTLAQRAHNCDAVSVLLAAVDPRAADWGAITRLCIAFLDRGLTIDWAGECVGTSWRGLECTDHCEPHVLDTYCATVAELVADGIAPADDREAVVAELAPAADALPDLSLAPVPPTDASAADLENWRDCAIEQCMVILAAESPLTGADVAALVAGMGDIRVRDVVLWRITVGERVGEIGDRRTWAVVSECVRRAPQDAVAPVAAVAALVAWQMGEGTRAMAALHRAWAADPDHSLATLVHRCVDTAAPASMWWQVMAGLDEYTCRYGHGQ